MPETSATQVFVPRIFDAPDTRGVVVKAYKADGDFVAADEPLIDLRSRDIDGEIVAPFAGTIVRLHALHGDTVSAGTLLADLRIHVPGPEPSSSGIRLRLGAQAPRVAALLCASPALVIPLAWLFVALATVLVLAVVRDVLERRAGGLGLAPLLLVPRLLARLARWVGSSVRAFTPLLAGGLRLLAGLGLAVLIPAVIGGGLWLAEHGGVGLDAAARIAVFDHAFRVFAFLACLWLARRFWRDPGRASALETAVRRLPAVVTVAAFAVAIAWTVVCVVALPAARWAPAADFRGAADLLPTGATAWVLQQRAAWAEGDAIAMSECLGKAGRGDWRTATVTLREDGSMVASIGAQPGSRAGDRSVATLLLAAQNQLEPHPLTVVAHMGGSARLRFDTIATRTPTTDIAALLGRAEATDAASERLNGLLAMKPTDVEVALRCSAAGL